VSSLNWQLVPLGEVADIVNGDRGKNYPSASNRVEFGIPFINAGHLDAGVVRLKSMDYISQDHYELLSGGHIHAGDVLLCIRGSLGRVALATSDVVPGAIASSLVILRSGPNLESRFLLAWLMSPAGRQTIAMHDNGSAQPNVGARDVARFRIPIPPLLDQQKIASILSAYDDLIENNTRRIQILEEMAQAIYREWFVEFRFPGHENVRMVDSDLGPIPEGWREESLSSLADLKWGDTSKTKRSYSASGYEVFSASGADGKSENYDFDLDGVVLSAIGAKCGKTWLAKGKWSCIKNTIRFWSDSPDVSTEYLYMATNSEDFWPKRGAAQPFIAQTDARAKRIAVPTHDVMRRFTDHLGPILDAIHVLSRTSENLRTIRDPLLPRLISGEIDVSNLDIGNAQPAA
jgi:type I restriction enzyme, S subunit